MLRELERSGVVEVDGWDEMKMKMELNDCDAVDLLGFWMSVVGFILDP